MPSAIDPAQIPGGNLDPDAIDRAAAAMTRIGTSVANQGAATVTTWQGLAGHYEAPEDETLFAVMDPVKTGTDTFGDNVGTVSRALTTFAEEIRPIKAELAAIKAEATSFVGSIANGVEQTTTTSMEDGGTFSSTETVEWHEDQDTVDANNALLERVNNQMELLWAAERTCANAIYDIIGAPHIEAATDANPNGYMVTDIPEGAETPWGTHVEKTEGCGEKTVEGVGRFVWDGVIVGGLWGTVQGLGSLTLGYNPNTGEWFDGDTYGAAWSNLGMLGVGLASTGLVGMALSQTPGPVGDFVRRGQQTLLEAGKGMIAYDQWSEDPWTAAGTATFNVGSFLVPAGAAVGGVRTSTSVAGAALRTGARAFNAVDPMTYAAAGLGRAGRFAAPSLRSLTANFSFDIKLDLPDTGGRPGVPGGGPSVNLPSIPANDVSLTPPRGGSPAAEAPAPRAVETPSAPDRVLVGSGGSEVRVESPGGASTVADTGGLGGSAGGGSGIGSVETAPGGAGGGIGGADGPPGPTAGGRTGGDGSAWDPEQGDPTLSDADTGPGWTRDPGHRGDPVDPEYGQPRTEHGTIPERYLPPPADQIPDPVRHLVTDPNAPYGRDAAGQPYTRTEYEARYTHPDGTPRYPGNDGAVAGRRIDYTDLDQFRRDYGEVVDRLGGPAGAFHSTPETMFENRALPGASLHQPYHELRIGDSLPPGTRIEVSEVAPAFGQPGGGIQVRFLDATGTPLSMREAVDQGVLVRESPEDVQGSAARDHDGSPESTGTLPDPEADGSAAPESSAATEGASNRAGDTTSFAGDDSPLMSEEGARRRPRALWDVEAQDAWADEVYREIIEDPDVDGTVAGHLAEIRRESGEVGFSAGEIAQIRHHLMAEEHLLTDYDTGGLVSRRFDVSADIAEAWIRLREGSATPSDIVLLEHELMESNYLRVHPGASYLQAHTEANKSFNWQRLVEEG